MIRWYDKIVQLRQKQNSFWTPFTNRPPAWGNPYHVLCYIPTIEQECQFSNIMYNSAPSPQQYPWNCSAILNYSEVFTEVFIPFFDLFLLREATLLMDGNAGLTINSRRIYIINTPFKGSRPGTALFLGAALLLENPFGCLCIHLPLCPQILGDITDSSPFFISKKDACLALLQALWRCSKSQVVDRLEISSQHNNIENQTVWRIQTALETGLIIVWDCTNFPEVNFSGIGPFPTAILGLCEGLSVLVWRHWSVSRKVPRNDGLASTPCREMNLYCK